MSDKKSITDSSLARMAGNIAAGFVTNRWYPTDTEIDRIAYYSVQVARAIIAQLEKEPAQTLLTDLRPRKEPDDPA